MSSVALGTLPTPERIPALDGLRGLAIALVLLWHTFNETRPSPEPTSSWFSLIRLSWSGVDLFFVLSGFLIGGILLDTVGSSSYLRTFYIRRAYRILPVYLIVITIYCLANSTLSSRSAAANTIPFLAYVTFTQNFWMASMGAFGAGGLAVTWSLAIEEQFYLIAPLAVRKLNVTKLTIALALIVAFAPFLRAIFLTPRLNCLGGYVLVPCRADALCLGVLCAIAKRNARIWRFVLDKRRCIFYCFCFFLAVATFFAVEKLPFCSGVMMTAGFSVLALLYTTLLLLSLVGPVRLIKLLEGSALRGLGKISYALYLFHLPLVIGCRTFIESHLRHQSFVRDAHAAALVPGALVGILIAIAFAKISYLILERPMLRQGHRYVY